MNQMNMHAYGTTNQAAGTAPNLQIQQQSGAMMQQQSSAMMQQQSSAMMQQQSSAMMQQQSNAMMQQQSSAMMQQQSNAMMQQQSNAMMQQQSSAMMQQQSSAMMQQQSSAMMQQQSSAMMQQQSSAMMQQQPGAIQLPSPQQMQAGPGPNLATNAPQQPPPEKMDNITKVKTLIGCYRECLSNTLKCAAQVLHQNHAIDLNSQKGLVDIVPTFDETLEEFFTLCDQMELHLRTAVTCIQQAQSASHYLPLTVIPSRLEPTRAQETTLSYPSFLSTVRLQISYAKDIHDTLVDAAQNIAPVE